MRFLLIQMIIVILICIFIAALSNLTELGIVGWILAGSTGHALYRIYVHLHNSMKSGDAREKYKSCSHAELGLSEKLQAFMFDDATRSGDE